SSIREALTRNTKTIQAVNMTTKRRRVPRLQFIVSQDSTPLRIRDEKGKSPRELGLGFLPGLVRFSVGPTHFPLSARSRFWSRLGNPSSPGRDENRDLGFLRLSGIPNAVGIASSTKSSHSTASGGGCTGSPHPILQCDSRVVLWRRGKGIPRVPRRYFSIVRISSSFARASCQVV